MHLNVFSKVYYDRVYFSCAERNMTGSGFDPPPPPPPAAPPYPVEKSSAPPPPRDSYAQQPLQPHACVQEHCPGKTGLTSSVSQAVHEMSLVLLFKVLNYPVWVYLEGNNAVIVSGKDEFIYLFIYSSIHVCSTMYQTKVQ